MRLSPRSPFRLSSGLFAVALIGAATVLAANSAASPAGSPDEASFLDENNAAMARMMEAMDIKPSGDVDADFVAMMVPHHQGAIDMAQAELRYGHNEQLRRMAQEIIVTQQQGIAAMRLALGQTLPPSAPSPNQQSSAVRSDAQAASPHQMQMQQEP